MKCAKIEIYCGKSNSLLELYFPQMGVCTSKNVLCVVGQFEKSVNFWKYFFLGNNFCPQNSILSVYLLNAPFS